MQEKPILSLCKPNRQVIGILSEAYDVVYEERLGDLSLLSFKVPFMLNFRQLNKKNSHINKIKEKYMIHFKHENKEEYFLVQKTVKSHDNSDDYYQVECSGLPIQLSYRTITSYSATSKTATQLLHDGLAETSWSVGSIHGDYDISFRSIEFTGSVLDFVFAVAETFEALVIFNTLNKTINLYNPKLYGINKGFVTSYGKLLDSITYESDSSEQATRLIVRGKDGLTLSEVTSTGSPYLEDYSYYYDDMSDELREALMEWTQLKAEHQNLFSGYMNQLDDLRDELVTEQAELRDLQVELQLIWDTLDVKNSQGEDVAGTLAQKSAKEAQISVKQTEVNQTLTSIANVNSQLQQLSELLVMENNLTAAQILELDEYIFEAEYSNEYVSDPDKLKQLAIEHFQSIREPQLTADIDIVNLFKVLDLQESSDRDKIVLGDLIHVQYELSNIEITAKIIGINTNFEDDTLTLTISNVEKGNSFAEKQAKAFYSSVSHSNAFAANKYAYDNTIARTDEVTQILNQTWSTINRQIEGGLNNSISMSRRGILVTDSNDPQRMVIVQNGVIALSKNGSNTWQTAMTPDGIIAERLFGQLLAGNNLLITNQSGSFTIDDNGITATEMNVVITRNDNKSRVLINAYDGLKLQKNTGTTASPVWSDQITLDTNGDVIFRGKVAIGTGNSIFKADESGIYLGNSSFSNAPFKVDPTGKMTASNIDVTGGKLKIGNNFNVDASGNATLNNASINGNINMSGGSISWANISSDPATTAAASAASTAQSTANNANSIANAASSMAAAIANGSYGGGSFINNKIIFSPTIMTGTSGRYLRLEGSRLESVDGNAKRGISLDGSTGRIEWYTSNLRKGYITNWYDDFKENLLLYHEGAVSIQGQFLELRLPSINIGQSGGQSTTTTTFYGNVDFSNVNNVSGLVAKFA